MGDLPDPSKQQASNRAAIIGLVVGTVGISLFIVLWLVLDSWGIGLIPQLAISICMPPALISAFAGAYFLLYQPRN